MPVNRETEPSTTEKVGTAISKTASRHVELIVFVLGLATGALLVGALR